MIRSRRRKKNFKKLFLIVAFSSLLFLLTFVSETFAKYKSDATGLADISIARWNIFINDQDIIEYSDISNVLEPTFIPSEHVKSGVLAPQVVGYYDIVINYTNVDVSFNYTIESNINEDSSVQDIIITGYSLNGGDIIPIEDKIEGTGLFTDTNKIKSYRVYITWSDEETDSMDNSQDTAAALSGENASIDVNVNFSQIISLPEEPEEP